MPHADSKWDQIQVPGHDVGDTCNNTARAVAVALSGIVPDGVVCTGGPILDFKQELFPQEQAQIARAVESRRREFSSGRRYAREALSKLLYQPQAIPMLPSRAPSWPIGAVGSISHCGDNCVAVAASRDKYLGIGVDIEEGGPLPEGTANIICGGAEMAQTASSSISHLPKVIFAIKEAVYKLYFPLTCQYLDFHDLTVTVDVRGMTFSAQLRGALPTINGSSVFAGRFGFCRGIVFALAWQEAAATIGEEQNNRAESHGGIKLESNKSSNKGYSV